jgi:hypothetical protein
MTPLLDPAVHAVLRAALAALLATAAVHKLRDRAAFRTVVADYALAPAALSGVLAAAVAASEVATVVLLLAAPAAGGVAAAVLFGVYAAAIGANLARGRRAIDCGCGGPAHRQTLSGWLVARNAGLVAAALLVALPVGARPLLWVDALTIAGGTAVAAAAWIALDRLLALVPAAHRIRGTA